MRVSWRPWRTSTPGAWRREPRPVLRGGDLSRPGDRPSAWSTRATVPAFGRDRPARREACAGFAEGGRRRPRQLMRTELESRGVDTRGPGWSHRPTGVTVVPSGGSRAAHPQSAIVGSARLARRSGPAPLARHVHVSSLRRRRCVRTAAFQGDARVRTDLTIRTGMDAGTRGILGALTATDLFLPNSAEARAITA
jgi:hypothetical protein